MVKGDIVLIPFPFTNLTGTKLRPALVLASTNLDVIVCFITSQSHRVELTDVHLKPNLANGLKLESVVRTSKIATLDKSLVTGLLGNLTQHELSQIDQSLKTFFQLP